MIQQPSGDTLDDHATIFQTEKAIKMRKMERVQHQMVFQMNCTSVGTQQIVNTFTTFSKPYGHRKTQIFEGHLFLKRK